MSNYLHKEKSVEVLCIGTELLLGNILNSNSQWLGEELASLGLPHYRQTVIGDNFYRLKETVIEASHRCRLLITTGGLGPTTDDLTTETIAAAFNTSLEERPKLWLDIKAKLSNKNQTPASLNRKQALFPLSAEIIPNKSGTAPGMIWSPKTGFTVMTFPGVPTELKEMWTQTAIQWIKENIGSKDIFHSKVLRFAGITESKLEEELAALFKNKNPTIAPYASLGEVKLRITAKGENTEEAKQLIIPYEKQIRIQTGEKCYGSDNDSLASVVIDLLRQNKEKLAIAESCTGGGIGAALTAIPGASEVFQGGVIAYSNSLKENLLNVPPQLIEKYGAVSSPVVEAMAKGALKLLQADWSLAISGLAGPGGNTDSKPVGLVHFAIADHFGCTTTKEFFAPRRSRQDIQELSVLKALDQLRLMLLTRS